MIIQTPKINNRIQIGSLLVQQTCLAFILYACCFFSSCSPDLSDDAIPFPSFSDIVINLDLPEYTPLRMDKGYKYIGSGIRGIILYRENENTYHAFERNCSYHPNEACATVEVHNSGLYITDPCCGSSFDFQGKPSGGVAWRPLRKYRTSFDGNELTITDEIVE